MASVLTTKLDEAEPYCSLPSDQVRVSTLYFRQLVASKGPDVKTDPQPLTINCRR